MAKFWPVLAVLILVWFGLANIASGLRDAADPRDWSDDYLRTEAAIAASRETVTGSTTSGGTSTYTCRYQVDVSHQGERHRRSAIWLNESYKSKRGEDCGAARYGEVIPVWMTVTEAEPEIMQVGNRTAKPMTVAFKILIGSGALLGGFFLGRRTWRRWTGARTN